MLVRFDRVKKVNFLSPAALVCLEHHVFAERDERNEEINMKRIRLKR